MNPLDIYTPFSRLQDSLVMYMMSSRGITSRHEIEEERGARDEFAEFEDTIASSFLFRS